MEIFKYLLLGTVQGLTEFLPVSSSGHLIILKRVLPGFDQPGIFFESFLHAGTLLSIIYYFRKSILKNEINYWLLVGIATVPAVFVGLFLSSQVESAFGNLEIVGFALLITGIINILTSNIKKEGKKLASSKKISSAEMKRSLVIGLFQAFAIIPGISRSGSTIFAGRKLGLSRRLAAEFSFLMSIPVVLGANVFEFLGSRGDINYFSYLYIVGFVASFTSGVFAIRIVSKYLEKANYKYFSYYTLVLGLLVIIIS